jgi:hypothetical protein
MLRSHVRFARLAFGAVLVSCVLLAPPARADAAAAGAVPPAPYPSAPGPIITTEQLAYFADGPAYSAAPDGFALKLPLLSLSF